MEIKSTNNTDKGVQVVNDLLNQLRQGGHIEIAQALEIAHNNALAVLERDRTQGGINRMPDKSEAEIIDEMIKNKHNDIIIGISGPFSPGIPSERAQKSFLVESGRMAFGSESHIVYLPNGEKQIIREVVPDDELFDYAIDGRNLVDYPEGMIEDTMPLKYREKRANYYCCKIKPTKRIMTNYSGYVLAFPEFRGDTRIGVSAVQIWIRKDLPTTHEYERILRGPAIVDFAVRALPGLFYTKASSHGKGFSGEELINQIKKGLAERYEWN